MKKSGDARLLSLDVFRGATIASMILVNDPGSWSAVYPPLLHAKWHGWTFTDVIFPFFLWIVGVAMTLSFARRIERGDDRAHLLRHVFRRASIIFVIGLFLNAFPYFELGTLRIPGVLQRIAVCYLIAAAIYLYSGPHWQVIWIGSLFAIYWVLMMFVPVPGHGAGLLEPIGNFAQWVDSKLLAGHMWSQTKVWDPEGIVSTLPSIATVLFGILAGRLLRLPLSSAEKTSWMLAWGNVMVLVALMLSPFMPINKSLWTVPFSILMAGLALVVFGITYWLVDVHGWRGWTGPFIVFGMNPIVVYFFAGVLADILSATGWQKAVYEAVFVPVGSPRNASLLYAIAFVLVCYAFAWVLYRRKWFLRL